MLLTAAVEAHERDDKKDAPATESKAPGRRPPLWLFLMALGSFPVILLFWVDVRDLHGAFMTSGHIWGRDFVNLWTGGRLAVEGRPELIYSLQEYVAYQHLHVGPIKPHYYSYPPSS